MIYNKDKVLLTTHTVTVSTHEVVKLFAYRKGWDMLRAVEYLLKNSLRQDYESMH